MRTMTAPREPADVRRQLAAELSAFAAGAPTSLEVVVPLVAIWRVLPPVRARTGVPRYDAHPNKPARSNSVSGLVPRRARQRSESSRAR